MLLAESPSRVVTIPPEGPSEVRLHHTTLRACLHLAGSAENIIESAGARSLVECMTRCTGLSFCVSFNYDKVQKICQLIGDPHLYFISGSGTPSGTLICGPNNVLGDVKRPQVRQVL